MKHSPRQGRSTRMPSRCTSRRRRGCGSIAGAIAGDGVEVAPTVGLRDAPCPLPIESVATILENNRDAAIQYWMELVKHEEELICIPLSFEDRTGHLLPLFADLVNRLRFPPTAKANISVARTGARRPATCSGLHRRYVSRRVANSRGQYF